MRPTNTAAATFSRSLSWYGSGTPGRITTLRGARCSAYAGAVNSSPVRSQNVSGSAATPNSSGSAGSSATRGLGQSDPCVTANQPATAMGPFSKLRYFAVYAADHTGSPSTVEGYRGNGAEVGRGATAVPLGTTTAATGGAVVGRGRFDHVPAMPARTTPTITIADIPAATTLPRRRCGARTACGSKLACSSMRRA